MPFQILIDIQRIQIFGIESGQQHIDDDGNIDLILMRNIFIAVLLRLDTTLNILIIGIEFRNRMIRPVLLIVIVDNPTQRGFLFAGIFLVIETLLGQILLYLLHILVAFGRRREDTCDIQRFIFGIFCFSLLLNLLEQVIVFDSIVYAAGGHDGIESTEIRGRIVTT